MKYLKSRGLWRNICETNNITEVNCAGGIRFGGYSLASAKLVGDCFRYHALKVQSRTKEWYSIPNICWAIVSLLINRLNGKFGFNPVKFNAVANKGITLTIQQFVRSMFLENEILRAFLNNAFEMRRILFHLKWSFQVNIQGGQYASRPHRFHRIPNRE